MEIPTARILDDGVLRFGYAQADPFRWYAVSMGIFPGLEATGLFTEVTNILSGLDAQGYGNNKDKAIDLKYQLIPEMKWLPAMAVGIHDFHGTQIFSSEYLVFSRRIYDFDITVGLGTERLKDSGTLPSDDVGLFGGIEWALHKRFHLIAEYNPVEYENDHSSIRGVPEGADSIINVGARINIYPGIRLALTYQRGNTAGFMCHIESELGKSIIHKRADPPLWASVDRRLLGERDPKQMVNKIRDALREAGFKKTTVYTEDRELTAEFENTKYLSNQKAAGRVLRILLFYSPADTTYLHAILNRRRISILKVSVNPRHLERYLLDKIPEDIFLSLLDIETPHPFESGGAPNSVTSDKSSPFDYNWGIKPNIETYLNDPSGVFQAKIGIQPYIESTFWKGGSTCAKYDIPFYSDITSSHNPPEDAVRIDSWRYMSDDLTFERLMFDQTLKLWRKSFFRVSFGYLEKMYAGVGGEFLTFFGSGNFALGIEGDWVKKREPATQLGLIDFESYTILGNIYYPIAGKDLIHRQKFDLTFHAQYGRFLAEDEGWMFNISRNFENGLVIGFWYSNTDTDDFTGPEKGYHDKGVFLRLPARMFSKRETNVKYNYAIAPWTRDVAATVSHWRPLYGLVQDLMPSRFEKNLERIKD